MEKLKPWFGRLTILVGLVGLVLTAAGPVFVWRAASVVSVRFVEIADLAVAVQERASQRAEWAEDVLETVQAKLQSLRRSAEHVSGSAPRTHDDRDVSPLLNQLDKELVRELRETRMVLESILTATDKLNQAVKHFDALSSPMQFFKKAPQSNEQSDLIALSDSLAETSQLIQQLIDFVAEIEQQGITDQQAEVLKQSVLRLNADLDQGQTELQSIREFLQVTRAKVLAKRESVPVWTKVGAADFTALLICLAFTQIQLIGYGRSFL